jgi:hypothetical protein
MRHKHNDRFIGQSSEVVNGLAADRAPARARAIKSHNRHCQTPAGVEPGNVCAKFVSFVRRSFHWREDRFSCAKSVSSARRSFQLRGDRFICAEIVSAARRSFQLREDRFNCAKIASPARNWLRPSSICHCLRRSVASVSHSVGPCALHGVHGTLALRSKDFALRASGSAPRANRFELRPKVSELCALERSKGPVNSCCPCFRSRTNVQWPARRRPRSRSMRDRSAGPVHCVWLCRTQSPPKAKPPFLDMACSHIESVLSITASTASCRRLIVFGPIAFVSVTDHSRGFASM